MGAMGRKVLKTRRARAELTALVVGACIVAGAGVATSGSHSDSASESAGASAHLVSE